QTLRHFYIDSRVIDEDSGVNKVRLTLDLAAAQARQKTVGLDQTDARLRKTYAITIPKRKLSADEIRIIENRVEAVSLTIGRVLITLRPEKRSAISQIIEIDRRFHRRHVRADVDRASGNRVAIVAAECVVVRVGQIQTAEMSVAIDSQIADLDGVRPHVANQCGPHQKPIAIKFAAATIVVVEHAG